MLICINPELKVSYPVDSSQVNSKKRRIQWDPNLHIRILKSVENIEEFHIPRKPKLRRFMKSVGAVHEDFFRVRKKENPISVSPEDVKEIRKVPKKENGDLDLVDVIQPRIGKLFRRLLRKQEYIYKIKFSLEFQQKIEDYLNQFRFEFHRRTIAGEFEVEELD